MNKLLHTPLTVHNVELANRLVMPPMATGKTPDAPGSSVPACPTLRTPKARRTTETTSCEVIPTGL